MIKVKIPADSDKIDAGRSAMNAAGYRVEAISPVVEPKVVRLRHCHREKG